MPYSVSKPMAALCCLILIDRGLLHPDKLVAEYWPEFAEGGKGDCTVAQLLEHRAGAPFVPENCVPEDLYDEVELTRKIALQPALWHPGDVLAEHAITFGHLCGALVRRITGESLGAFFQREVAECLSADLHFGVPQERLDDCAALSAWPTSTIQELKCMSPLAEVGLFQPDVLCQPSVVNSREWRQAQIPAVNLHCTARDIAKVYSSLAGSSGTQLVTPATANLLQTPSAPGIDKVFGFEAQWALGFQHNDWSEEETGSSIGSTFGLGGIGGSVAFGCRIKSKEDTGIVSSLGFAYLTRQMGSWERADYVQHCLLKVLVDLQGKMP